MPTREQQVLDLIRGDLMLSQQAIADQLGISRSAVAGHVMNLTAKGLIRGRGYVLAERPFVAVIGGANIDIYGKAAAALVAGDSNPGSVRVSAGGVARNVAENLARLRVDARLVSVVGRDHYGDTLLSLTRQAGVDTRDVDEIAGAATSTYLSVAGPEGDMRVAINDMAVMERLDAGRLRRHEAMLRQAALVVVDGNLSADTLAWIADTLDGRTLFADAVSAAKAPRLRRCLGAVHTLKMNALEAEALTGLPARSHADLSELAPQLHAQGVERVFVTLGDAGVFFSTAEARGITRWARREQAVENTGGAGDAFLAGLAYAWLERLPLDESLQVALAAAQITLGATESTAPELSLAAVARRLEAANG